MTTYTPTEDLRGLAARVALVLPTGSQARQEALYLSTAPHSAQDIAAGLVAVRDYLEGIHPAVRVQCEDIVLEALKATRMLPGSV